MVSWNSELTYNSARTYDFKNQQYYHQNNVRDLFKLKNKNFRTTSLMSFSCLYYGLWTYLTHCLCSSIIDFPLWLVWKSEAIFNLVFGISYIWLEVTIPTNNLRLANCDWTTRYFGRSERKCFISKYAKRIVKKLH